MTTLRGPQHTGESQEQRCVYTVMADCGVGEFLWKKEPNDKCLVGYNYFSMMDDADDQDLISEGLFTKMWDWAKEFMDGKPDDCLDPWQIDWDQFNARGIELTRLLKEELGDTAYVQYVRSDEDPDSDSSENLVMLYL